VVCLVDVDCQENVWSGFRVIAGGKIGVYGGSCRHNAQYGAKGTGEGSQLYLEHVTGLDTNGLGPTMVTDMAKINQEYLTTTNSLTPQADDDDDDDVSIEPEHEEDEDGERHHRRRRRRRHPERTTLKGIPGEPNLPPPNGDAMMQVE